MSYDVNILKALADETRLEIVLNLLKKEMSVLEIAKKIQKSQPNTSIALKKLEYARLIEPRRQGKKIYFKIKDKPKINKLLEIIKHE